MSQDLEQITVMIRELKMRLHKVKDPLKSCDTCESQEEGGHYCLLHTKTLKNMNIIYCDDWEEKMSNNESNLLEALKACVEVMETLPSLNGFSGLAVLEHAKEVIEKHEKNSLNDTKEDSRIVTCVYCGQAYPEGTPTHGAEILTKHIKVCQKHPMRTLEQDNEKLCKEVEKSQSLENASRILGKNLDRFAIVANGMTFNPEKIIYCVQDDAILIKANVMTS